MPKSLSRVYRGLSDLPIVREHRNRLSHELELSDPRSAAEHRIAHQRSLDQGGNGCPFCR